MPVLYDLRVSSGFAQVVICATAFTGMLLYGLIVPVLPFALSERIGLPEDEIQKWNSILFGAYGVAITVGSIFFGYIGDLTTTRKAPYVAGLLLLILSTILFALARSVGVLLLARICQGLSSSISATVGKALLLDKVGKKSFGNAAGWTALSVSLGFFVGPLIGGLLYQYAGWFAVFVPSFILIPTEILGRLLVIEENRWAPKRTLEQGNDTDPLLRSGQETIPDTVANNPEGDNKAQPNAREHLSRVRSSEQDTSSKVIYPAYKLLASKRLLIAMESMLVLNSLFGAIESVLPLYCHELFGFKPSEAALLFVPLTIPMFFSPAAGKLVDRLGPKRPVSASFLLVAISFVVMAFVLRPNLASKIMLLVALVTLGLTATFAFPAILVEVILSVDEFTTANPSAFGAGGAFSLAIGLNHSMDSLGMLLGVIYGGSIREAAGWQAMCFFMAALCTLTLCLVIPVTGGSLGGQKAQGQPDLIPEGNAEAGLVVAASAGSTLPIIREEDH